MMPPVWTPLIGRFGNKLFQYAYARALAENESREFRTPAWEGEELFNIPVVNHDGKECEVIGGYRQNQESLIYTRSRVKACFSWKPEVEKVLLASVPVVECAAHLRRGDFAGYGFPLVSKRAYEFAIANYYKWNSAPFAWITEEEPFKVAGLPDFVGDFYRMTRASVLFRANSSFSWWAGTLGDGQVFSPVIDGNVGGREHDCNFVAGNWPKLSEVGDCTDLHMTP
jgi:hypothetical protein